jgi:type IV pilus assembly protein PilE
MMYYSNIATPLTERPVRNDQKGFTLIELMIVVAIIAILASVAYPSYQEYVKRSRRVEGQTLLSEAAARQERWRAQNGSYMTSYAATDIAKLKLPYGSQSEHGYYNLTISGDATSYTLKAVRAGVQISDSKCGDFTLDSAGSKGMVAGTPGTVADCWR